MTRLFRIAAALAALTPIAAGSAAPRSPTARWVVDFADQQCVASRDYGSAADPLTLVLKPDPTGKILQIAVFRKAYGGQPIEVPAVIAIDGVTIQTSLLGFDSKPAGLRSVRTNLPMEKAARLRGATLLEIHGRDQLDESFRLSLMSELMSAMASCLDDLQTVWNIKPELQAKLREHAAPTKPLVQLISDSDYPGLAISKDEAGNVSFTLLVDESGAVADCTVTGTSNVAVLDVQSCAVFKARAHFRPAIGADGKPAKDMYSNRIRWVMPG